MADDLVERLRKASEDYSLWCKDDCAKAADEINRLRVALNSAQSNLRSSNATLAKIRDLLQPPSYDTSGHPIYRITL